MTAFHPIPDARTQKTTPKEGYTGTRKLNLTGNYNYGDGCQDPKKPIFPTPPRPATLAARTRPPAAATCDPSRDMCNPTFETISH
jgi:hypothetical protein